MTNRNTRRAFLASLMALILCVSSLLGTTYAWFTDSVTSANNIISSGNLDVELYHTNSYIDNEKVNGLTDLFTVEGGKPFLWEPGAIVWENFKVANEGSLALKYQFLLNFFDATKTAAGKTLADVLKVAVVAGGFSGTREDAQALDYNYSLSTFALEGNLNAGADPDVYGIVIYWEPSANDNDYNVKGGLSITLGVNLFATQLAAENDGFGNDFDVEAPLPEVPNVAIGNATAAIKNDGSASVEVDAAPSASTNKTTIDASAGAFKTTDKVDVNVTTTNSLFDVNAAGSVVATLDITMTVNGTETSADLTGGKVYTVTTYVSKGLTNVSVAYTGTDGKDQPTLVSYNPVTGELVFTTTHFSNYAVSGTALAYDAKNDTALVTIEQVVAASKVEGNTVVIPEENNEAIKTEIEKLPAADKEAAIAATYAAKIGEVSYTTLAEAFDAAKDGDTIVLINDVVTSNAITNAKKVTLNLNGKTIVGTDNATGSFGLITNNGELTITGNGKMTLVATNDRDWNAYSSVISNSVGGKLVVENGTLEHLGGTDMAYGIDNLTNGKGTYAETVINGGTIKSTYRAIRMFLNGIEAQNILTINGGTIEGANKSVWMQDPSKNANTGTLTVSEKATLKGDVYLFVTAGSTAWPVTVSIAEAAVNGDVVTGNVPLGYRVELANGTWTVLKSDAVVKTTEELKAALAAGNNDIAVAKGEYTFPASSFTENVTLRCEEGVVFTGTSALNINGATVIGATFKNEGGQAVSGTIYAYLKDCTFIGQETLRWCYTNAGETTVFENCVIKTTLRGFHFDVMDGDVIFKNCEINGFNAYSGKGTLTLDGCALGNDASGYNGLNIYTDTVLTNCTFNFVSGKTNFIDYEAAGKTLTITDCKATLDGEEANVADFLGGTYLSDTTVTIDGKKVVLTADQLVAALEGGETVVVMGRDIKIDPANMSNAYGKTGINVKNGQTIDGNGYTLNIKGAGGTWDSGINTTGGVIKNLTVTGSFRGIFINHTSEHSEKVVLENVVIGGNGTVYTISCDQGLYQGIEAINCTFNGWTSFAETAGEARFVNCTFGEGSGYAYCRPYSNTEFVNCTFSEGYVVDTTRATVTFTDCENPTLN